LVGVLAYKGAMKVASLGFVDNSISKAICYPFKLAMNLLGKMYGNSQSYQINKDDNGETK